MTDLKAIFTRLSLYDDGSLLAKLQVRPTWLDRIKDKQLGDKFLELLFRQVEVETATNFKIDSDGVLCFRGRICVPNDEELRLLILREAHSCPYAMHPGGDKMYKDLRELYWWPGLKCEVFDFVARCLTCQQRKYIEYSVRDLVFLNVLPWKKVLRPYRSDPTHVVPVEKIEVRPDLTFENELVQILDHDTKVLQRKSIPLVKVL
ncbi:uncharacterized protein [Gossypium hirsutum]|uniref:Integrase zinc-binding domain-containing protein n=1 Tax=Gossypium hirsutum TaxID=3635 RepID=A0A1U8LRK7_GOSHI|nr:uncharacterized protein LOC107930142 [Gossypium hirsutum]